MNPNLKISQLQEIDFINFFSELIENLCLYKGISLNDDILVKMLKMIYGFKQKYSILTVQQATLAITSLYNSDIKKITVESIDKVLMQTNLKIFQQQDEEIQNKALKAPVDSDWGRAVSMRLKHDPGAKILDENNDTLKDIFDAIKKGYNYYTLEKL